MGAVSGEQFQEACSLFLEAQCDDREKEKRYERASRLCRLAASLLNEKKRELYGNDGVLFSAALWGAYLFPEKGVYLRMLAAEHGAKKAQRDLYDQRGGTLTGSDGIQLAPEDLAAEAYILYEGAQQGDVYCIEALIRAFDEGSLFEQNYAEAAYWHKRYAECRINAKEAYEGQNQRLIQRDKGNFWLDGLLGQAQADFCKELPRPSFEKTYDTEAMRKLEKLRVLFEERAMEEFWLDTRWAKELSGALPGKFGGKSGGLFGNPYRKPEKALEALESADRLAWEQVKKAEKGRYQKKEELEKRIGAELERLGLEPPYGTASGVSYLFYHSMICGTETLKETMEQMAGCWRKKENRSGETAFVMPKWLLSHYGEDADWVQVAWDCYEDKSKDYNGLLALLAAFFVYQKECGPFSWLSWREPIHVKQAAAAFARMNDSRMRKLAIICYQWFTVFCKMVVEETFGSRLMPGIQKAEAAYELCEVYGDVLGDRYESCRWGKLCLEKNLYHPKMSYWAARHPEDYCSGIVEQRNYASVAAEHGVEGARELMEALDRNIRYQEEQKTAARRLAEEEIRSQMMEYEELLDRREKIFNEILHGDYMTHMERQLRGYVPRDLAHTLAYIRSGREKAYEKELREAAERRFPET